MLQQKTIIFNCSLDTKLWLFDLNRDGIKDLIGLGRDNNFKVAVSSKSTNSWTQSDSLWLNEIPHVSKNGINDSPILLFSDFSGDSINDLLIFTLGPLSTWDYVLPDGQIAGAFLGLPAQMFVGMVDGKYTSSSQISDVYQSLVSTSKSKTPGNQIDNRISVKDVAFADIDGDGDLDLWLESSGGWNITSHFLINGGKSSWSVDQYNRIKDIGDPNYIQSGEMWRYSQGKLSDINSDGFPDLILGQMRAHAWQQNAHSYILLNDKKGFFPLNSEIDLPPPKFNDGWTKVVDLVAQDLNGDGRKDLVLLHIRYGTTTEEYKKTSFIGEYIQLLYQDENGKFIDQSWRLGDQTNLSQTNPPADQAQGLTVLDFNSDTLPDIALKYNWNVSATDLKTPWLFLQNGYAAFEKVDPFFYTDGDKWFGENAVIEDLDGDGLVEIISTDLLPGKDGIHNTGDEVSSIIVSYLTSPSDINSIPSSRYPFKGHNIALDINGNAGTTAKLLGAVFGKDSLTNKQYVGIGLSLLDAGMSTTTLASLAVDAANLKTNDQIVSTLWKNVFGTTATSADKAPYIKLLDDGMSAGTLAWLAADSDFNKANINLVGLAQTGIEYIPVN